MRVSVIIDPGVQLQALRLARGHKPAGEVSARGHIVRRGDHGRIIREVQAGGKIRSLHATKGWRAKSVSA